MASGQALGEDIARRFRGGRPCIDLAHTGGDGPAAAWEILHSPADLERWLAVITGAPAVRARAGDLEAARELRGAVWRSAGRRARGAPLAAEDVAMLNAHAAGPPMVVALDPEGRRAVTAAGSARQALSTLARDAIDLLSGPLAGRIRVCAADDCGLLLVDSSRPGRRRWCSMERCGNRAKVRAIRARRAGVAGTGYEG
jgi:predicted RNA-binding Zn ribbon-like protein